MLKVLVKGCEPTKATEFSSCIDLYASQDVVIRAGETKIVPLGVKIDLEKILDGIDSIYPHNEGMLPEYKMDYFMKTHCFVLKCRSSLTLEPKEDKPHYKGLIIANGVGEIDIDYPSEIGIILHKPIKATDIASMIMNTHEAFKDNEHIDCDVIIIKKGEKIAQIKLVEHKSNLIGVSSKNKRVGGYGSTGGNNATS